jgi:hypothetical protein
MIRAYVHDEHYGDRIAISIIHTAHDDPASKRILRIHVANHYFTTTTWEEMPRNEAVEPTLQLPHDAAHALLAALTNHYQGVDDQRALRKDYDAERGRVDQLIDTVAQIAKGVSRG